MYYLSPPDPSWSAEEQAAYIPSQANLLFVSTHEVWPGHFLQFQWSNRTPSVVGGLWVGYAFAEGWGHYAEEMMWETGLGNGDPETHIGQLFNALERNQLDTAKVDDVILGCVAPVGEQGSDIARVAAINAEISHSLFVSPTGFRCCGGTAMFANRW